MKLEIKYLKLQEPSTGNHTFLCARILVFMLTFNFTNFITFNSYAQNLAGGSYDGSHMAQVSPCAATVYTNIFIGGSYDGENMAQVSPCAATVYTNIYTGGSYDGENMIQVSPCAATVYTNIFIGGSCGGEYASVSECPSETWIYPTCATRPEALPTPIELLKFTAKLIDNKYVLTEWVTATEINNDYFIIERSKGNDTLIFEQIGTMKGAGNSSQTLYYAFNDEYPYSGLSYYRLKQVDYDGKYSYSDIRAVYWNDFDIIKLSPNPAEDEISVLLYATEKTEIQVEIYNVLGQKTTKETQWVNKGLTVLQYDVSSLSTGYYMLRVITTSGLYRVQRKLIKN